VSRKRILFLLPAPPEPPDAGAKLRNLGLLHAAAAEHQVDVLAFQRPPVRSRPRRLRDALRSKLPDMALRLWSPRLAAEVRHRLSSASYDLVQAEGIEMAAYLNNVPPAQRAYDAHNPEALLQRRAWAAAARRREPLAAAYSLLQWRRLERFERAVVRGSRLTLAVSYHDANQLEALAGRVVHVVPSGIDVERFCFEQPSEDDQPNLLFVGKLDYRPNAEALRWLIGHVLPRLFEQAPRARLFAVGADPPPWLVSAGQRDQRIAVTGAVADERPYLRRAALLLLPLEVAAGSRLKALVALASGLPIVSSPIGMEGLEASPGEHYACVPELEPAAWAAALAGLLSDPAQRQQLALAGRKLVEQRYSWEAVAPALYAAYAELTP
jgi:glycosyltransferase involved in cell wall biosynthesis